MRRLLAALLVLAALAPATAGAAITATQIVAPADGDRVTGTDDTTQVAVSGVATGGAINDNLTLRCYQRPGHSTPAGSATVTDVSGAFTGTALLGSTRGPCILRALPVDVEPATVNVAPFSGPPITVEAQRAVTLSEGLNAGTIVDVSDWLQQGSAGVGLCSLGSTGLCGGRLFDADARVSSEPVFHAGGWIGANTGSRSYLQVDGANAYPPYRASLLNAAAPGLPGLTRTTVRDTGGGAASEVESSPLVRCNTATFPPGDACTAFQDTGVRYERTSVVATDGTTVEQQDALVSTDGQAHTVSAYRGENFVIDPTVTPALRFGWISGDLSLPRSTGEEIGGLTKGPATIYVASNSAAGDGDPVYAQGAITFDRPPASVRVTESTDLLVRFPDISVPAGGRATLVHATYVMAHTAADVQARALAREDQLVSPTVSFIAPKTGATVLTPTITVIGTAGDNQGIASLTVAGQAAAVAANGRFTAQVPVTKGANTITAVAVDHAGNRAEATLKVTYQDRLAPAVGRLSITPRVWRVGRATSLRFSLGEAGTMRLTATQLRGGRRRHGACVAPTRALRRARAKACARRVRIATFVQPVQAGSVIARIGPKLGGRVISPGRVQLRVTVTDYAYNVSPPQTYDVTVRPPLKPIRRTPR